MSIIKSVSIDCREVMSIDFNTRNIILRVVVCPNFINVFNKSDELLERFPFNYHSEFQKAKDIRVNEFISDLIETYSQKLTDYNEECIKINLSDNKILNKFRKKLVSLQSNIKYWHNKIKRRQQYVLSDSNETTNELLDDLQKFIRIINEIRKHNYISIHLQRYIERECVELLNFDPYIERHIKSFI